MELIDNWVINTAKYHKNRLLVVMYEDLKGNEEQHILRMVKFLKMGGSFENTNEELPVTRPLQNFTVSFHRKHGSTEGTFEPYTSQQRGHVLNIITQTQKKLERHNLTSILDVSRYMGKSNGKALVGKLLDVTLWTMTMLEREYLFINFESCKIHILNFLFVFFI